MLDFETKCRAEFAGPLNTLLDPSAATRTLTIDGRPVHKNNGIGNLFGDYLGWFLVAMVSGRRMKLDWTRSNGRPRFSLGDHFVYQDGSTSWGVRLPVDPQQAPNRLPLATHDQSGLMLDQSADSDAARRADTSIFPTCARLTDSILSNESSVTLRLGPWSAALLPRCIDKTGKPQIWPYEAETIGRLVVHINAQDGGRQRFTAPPDPRLWRIALADDRATWGYTSPAEQLWADLLSCVLHGMMRPSERFRAYLDALSSSVPAPPTIVAHVRTGWWGNATRAHATRLASLLLGYRFFPVLVQSAKVRIARPSGRTICSQAMLTWQKWRGA